MMKLLHISDLHGHTSFIDALADELEGADLVALSGDLTNFGGRHKTVEIITAIEKYNRRIVGVPGNCDRSGVGEYLSERSISVDRFCMRIDDYTLCGLGGSLPCPGHTPNEFSEAEFDRFLAGIDPGNGGEIIYVIHQPPADTLVDRVSSGAHVGSRSVRSFLEASSGILCLTGHIHESAAVDKLNSVTVVNPGPARHGRYAYIEIDNGNVEVELRSTP